MELHPLALEHAPPLRAASRAGDTWRYMPFDVGDEAAWSAHFAEWVALPERGAGCLFAVRHRACGAWVGASGFLAPAPAHRRVEVGATWVASAHRGRGVNPAVKRLLLELAFEGLGCERVEFKTDARNAASRAALERLGARPEGVHRHHMLMPDGAWRDSAWFALLRAEWPDARAALDARLARRDSRACAGAPEPSAP